MTDTAALQAKIAQLEQALEADPMSKAFIQLADAYRQLGQFDKALQVALKGTWNLPDEANGYVVVGQVYTQQQSFDTAQAAFQKALSINQSSLPAYKGLARVFREQGMLAEAEGMLIRAMTLAPEDKSVQQMLEALHASPQASAPAPAAPQPQPVEAAPVATADGGEGDMKPITTATIADIYIEQGLYDKALDVYREILAAEPDNTQVKQKVAELQTYIQAQGSAQPAVPAAGPGAPPQAAAPETAAPAPPAAETGGDVLEKLNQWLDAIQTRRSHV